MAEKITKTNQSVDKMLDIIEIMAKNGRPMRLSEISEAGDMSQSTSYRLVNALLKREYVIQDERNQQYLLSPKFSLIGHLAAANLDIRNMAHPYMETLSRELSSVCYLGVPQGDELVYIDMITPPMSVLDKLPVVGKHIPLCFGGIGVNILSDYSDGKIKEFFQRIEKGSLESQNLNEDDIMESIMFVREHGYCISESFRHHSVGTGSISTGIRNYTGHIIGGISIGGNIEKFNDEFISEASQKLMKASDEISKLMAYKAL